MTGQIGYPLDVLYEINFDALENPTWRTQEGQMETVEGMISDIMKNHKRWKQEEDNHDKELVKKVKDKFLLEFITHVNREEEHGVSTVEETINILRPKVRPAHRLKRSQSIEERETMNLEKAYVYLLETTGEERPSDYGLLEVSLLEETHKIILHDIQPSKKNQTKPGQMSGERRVTEFKGETYEYPQHEDMKNEVNKLLDKYNILFDACSKHGLNEEKDYYNFFKLCAWLLFELLDLHPFSDGNGRLCRILGSYLLSSFTPFPTPIYNVWTKSSKDDYKQALVDARKKHNRQPRALATMIIECNWCGWRNFLKELDEGAQENISTGTDKGK
ncbi:uncharacterized protein [Montipora foliosa]|uniref:uncharacterized protein n=1 Tax=Montipora foliosa TaxID=591990 RepID=UPI0035F18AD1